MAYVECPYVGNKHKMKTAANLNYIKDITLK